MAHAFNVGLSNKLLCSLKNLVVMGPSLHSLPPLSDDTNKLPKVGDVVFRYKFQSGTHGVMVLVLGLRVKAVLVSVFSLLFMFIATLDVILIRRVVVMGTAVLVADV